MKSLHAARHTTRIVLGTVAVLALLAATTAAASSTPITSDLFLPGWQAHAKPLINMGISFRVPDRTKWYVPAILPLGDYVLVQRKGDTAEVIEGYRFTVRPGNNDVYLFLTAGLGDVQALPAADVPAAKPLANADTPH